LNYWISIESNEQSGFGIAVMAGSNEKPAIPRIWNRAGRDAEIPGNDQIFSKEQQVAINLKALEALKDVIKQDPGLQEKLQSTPDIAERMTWLGEIAAARNIPFDTADQNQFLESTAGSPDTRPLTESQLDLVAAGGAGDDFGRALMGFFYGTGVGGALVSIAAELSEPGGAKKMADYVFHDGPPLVPKS
jgi:hypothetical protein